jgi:hypothetical protein
MPSLPTTTASCRCGAVVLELTGAPIAHAACYCHSCQEAGRRIGALPDAPAVVGADGGTDLILWRKDQARCVKGADRLEGMRLKPTSPTRRMVATCCHSAMFLDFSKGHWASLYRGRLPGDVPPLDARVMTAEKPDGVVLPDDVPNAKGMAGRMFWKLLKAWAAMGFRIPKMAGVPD